MEIEKKITMQMEKRGNRFLSSRYMGSFFDKHTAQIVAKRQMDVVDETVSALQVCEDQRVIHRWERQDDLSWDKVI